MPTYEYACRSCGEHHDVVQSFGDDPLTECPTCRGPLRKVFGSVGVVFKGSGFYKTDSRAAATNGKKPDKDTGDTEKPSTEKPSTEKPSTDGSAKEGTSGSEASSATKDGGSSGSSSTPDKKASGTSAAAAS